MCPVSGYSSSIFKYCLQVILGPDHIGSGIASVFRLSSLSQFVPMFLGKYSTDALLFSKMYFFFREEIATSKQEAVPKERLVVFSI